MRYEMLRVFYIDCRDFKTENYPFLAEEIPKYALFLFPFLFSFSIVTDESDKSTNILYCFVLCAHNKSV